MPERKSKIAFFGDDFSRKGRGTALVIQKIAEEIVLHHDREVEVVLLRPKGTCEGVVCERARSIIIPRRFSTLLSYLWFFLWHRERYDAIVFNRVVYPGFFFLRARTRILYAHDASMSEVYQERVGGVNLFFDRFLRHLGVYWLDAVVVVSNDAAKWLACRFHIPKGKVRVIYNGVGEEFLPLGEPEKAHAAQKLQQIYGIRSPYILSVARFDPHKNVARIIEAFSLMKEEYGIPHALVLVGGPHSPGYSERILAAIAASPHASDIHVISYAGQTDMPLLYACADMLLYPSLIEGFGLPILEAMRCGTPVVTSNISSMPEIAGEAAILIDPLDPASIAHAAAELLRDESVRNTLIVKGLEQARTFTWQKTAAGLLALIRSRR